MIRTLEDIMHTLGHMTYQLEVLKADKTFIAYLNNAFDNVKYALEHYMNNEPAKDEVK